MDFKDVVYQRRAVDFFDPDVDVPENTLREMIELAARSPSSFNLQPWQVVVVREPAEKETLRKNAWDQPKVTDAPVVLIILADRDAWKKGHPLVEKNFAQMQQAGSMKPEQYDWFTGATQSLYGVDLERQQAGACKHTGFFAMTLMFAAKHLGFDSLPMDGFDVEGVREAFRIPENYWIPLLLAVGRFRKDEELSPPKWRRTFDEIIVSF